MRFDQFNREWERKSIGDLINEVKEYTSNFEKYPLYSFTIESGVTPKTERYERNFLVKKNGDLFKVVHPNNFVMNPMNLRFGAINYSKQTIDVSISGYYDIFEIDNSNYNDFWNAYFKAPQTINIYNAIATGSLIEKKRVHFSQLKSLKFYLPSNDEKKKINSFIKLLDDRISVQIKIIDDLKVQKNYIITLLLDKLQNKKYIQLNDILDEYSEKTSSNDEFPVLSSTASGIFLQSEYFNKEAASADTTGYKIIPRGYCTYRSMSDTGYFTFNQQNILDKGIISPAYPVFYSKKYLNEFVILYLNYSKQIKKQILELKTGGTRFALSFKTLSSFKIPEVDIFTQQNILEIVSSLSAKIDNENNIYGVLIKEKMYLLNNMFI